MSFISNWIRSLFSVRLINIQRKQMTKNDSGNSSRLGDLQPADDFSQKYYKTLLFLLRGNYLPHWLYGKFDFNPLHFSQFYLETVATKLDCVNWEAGYFLLEHFVYYRSIFLNGKFRCWIVCGCCFWVIFSINIFCRVYYVLKKYLSNQIYIILVDQMLCIIRNVRSDLHAGNCHYQITIHFKTLL